MKRRKRRTTIARNLVIQLITNRNNQSLNDISYDYIK